MSGTDFWISACLRLTSQQSSSAFLRGHLNLVADPRTVFEDSDSDKHQIEIPVTLQQNNQNCFQAFKVGDIYKCCKNAKIYFLI